MQQFWQYGADALLSKLQASSLGLSSEEARLRLFKHGRNALKSVRKGRGWFLFFSQFKSPLILILVAAAILSFFLSAHLDALIICVIVFFSGLLGFFQERGAIHALEKVMQLVKSQAVVLRDGIEREVPTEEIVPGDIVILNAGDLVPADCSLLESHHLFVDEAMLTGESLPVEKKEGIVRTEASLQERTNALFFGSMIASGFGKALVIATGKNTQFGEVIEKIRFRPPETAFALGLRKFGFFLMEVTLFLVIAIFAFNIYFQRPVLESFLFSIALAVGLTPQLLPAIISVNLARGARKMAAKKVVVKRLDSMEDFGQMDILCTDKTGTLTQGKMQLEKAVDYRGDASEKSFFMGSLNAHFQTGYTNPLDTAILDGNGTDFSSYEKIDEIPYDFSRKRLSVVLQSRGKKILIAKGAVHPMLSVCTALETISGKVPLPDKKEEIEIYFKEVSRQGLRLLAVAYGEGDREENLTLAGFLIFKDPLKEGIIESIKELKNRGISLKILTGDTHLSALHVAESIGLSHAHVVIGEQLRDMSESALLKIVREKNVFAEVDPFQKDRIILALKRGGHVVGYLGDGINDVAALHSADVGISVEGGADAAKEASDIVLLDKDLHVLRQGVEEGRHTFANTLKYVYMATSANFGNMFSMAGASLFLSFLPLLPKQVLLTNLLTDFPEMAIATDHVDLDIVKRPIQWDLPFIRRFMIFFGLLSSVFDFATFGVLLFYLKADVSLFRTGWFVESVISATLVVLVIRTRKPFFLSFPSRILTLSILGTAVSVLFIPVTPLGVLFGFVPLPASFYGALAGILGLYFVSAESLKRWYFRK